MAISRAQLAKELEPGLNALFGMEYGRYEGQHAEIFDTESSDRAFEEEVMLSGFGAAPVKNVKVQVYHLMMRMKHTLLVTTTRQWQWPSQSLKKLWKTICMIVWLHAILVHLHVLWHTQSRLKLHQF